MSGLHNLSAARMEVTAIESDLRVYVFGFSMSAWPTARGELAELLAHAVANPTSFTRLGLRSDIKALRV